jgi:hypothetical protein
VVPGTLLSPLNRMTELYAHRVTGSLTTNGVTARDLADFVFVWLRRSRDGNSECRVWFDMDLIANGVRRTGTKGKVRKLN